MDNGLLEQQNEEEKKAKKKRVLVIILALVILIIVLYVAYEQLYGKYFISTDNAYVRGNIISITPQISGSVKNVSFESGQVVTAGDVLFNIDDTSYQNAYYLAVDGLRTTVAQYCTLKFNLKKSDDVIRQLNTVLDKVAKDYNRYKELYNSKVIPVSDYEKYYNAYIASSLNVSIAKSDRMALMSNLGSDKVLSAPSVLSATTRLVDSWLNLQRTTIRSPINGYVAKKNVQVGQAVSPNVVNAYVVDKDNIWIEANFKETELRGIEVGQTVDVKFDMYGSDVKMKGIVDGFVAGTGGTFSLLPPENAVGNWIKTVQRIPVIIRLTNYDPTKTTLMLGLSAEVTIDIRQSGKGRFKNESNDSVFNTKIFDYDIDGVRKFASNLINETVTKYPGCLDEVSSMSTQAPAVTPMTNTAPVTGYSNPSTISTIAAKPQQKAADTGFVSYYDMNRYDKPVEKDNTYSVYNQNSSQLSGYDQKVVMSSAPVNVKR